MALKTHHAGLVQSKWGNSCLIPLGILSYHYAQLLYSHGGYCSEYYFMYIQWVDVQTMTSTIHRNIPVTT